jgi:peptidoglycan/LPS O-acetylase OafA/YrhL
VSAPKLKQWEIIPSSGSHFDILDGLRGVAILMVVAFHTLRVNPTQGLAARLASYFITAGWMGVPVFFVLSGFLISYPFFKKRAADPQFWYQRGYIWRRVGKILPPFYLSIVLFLGLYWWQYRDPAYFSSAWKWAVGLGNFIQIKPNFNGVYWSLLVESHYYLVLPLLFWLTRGWSVRRTSGILFFIFFAGPLIARQFTWPDGVYVLPDPTSPLHEDVWLKLTRFPCQLDYFGWGVVFASVFVSLGNGEGLRPLSSFGYIGVGFMIVTLIEWGVWSEQFHLGYHAARWSVEISHFLPAVATMLMLFFLFDRHCWGARILGCAPLRFTGIVSYEWFLFHQPVVIWFCEHSPEHAHGSVWWYAWKTLAPMALTFGFSVLVYRYFSLPILNWVRNRAGKS